MSSFVCAFYKFFVSSVCVCDVCNELAIPGADLPILMNRRLQNICILMYEVKHKLCPTYICNIFKNHNSYYFLRQSDFSISSYNTVTYGKNSLRYLGPRLWGTLSPDVGHAKTLDDFKNKIRGCNSRCFYSWIFTVLSYHLIVIIIIIFISTF